MLLRVVIRNIQFGCFCCLLKTSPNFYIEGYQVYHLHKFFGLLYKAKEMDTMWVFSPICSHLLIFSRIEFNIPVCKIWVFLLGPLEWSYSVLESGQWMALLNSAKVKTTLALDSFRITFDFAFEKYNRKSALLSFSYKPGKQGLVRRRKLRERAWKSLKMIFKLRHINVGNFVWGFFEQVVVSDN